MSKRKKLDKYTLKICTGVVDNMRKITPTMGNYSHGVYDGLRAAETELRKLARKGGGR